MKRFINSPLEGWQSNSPLEGWQAGPDGVEKSWRKNSLFPYWNLPKNPKLKDRARALRKQGILSEVIFWQKFKDKKVLSWDIDRQVIIDNFIVDFFIPELGLVFEIDGSSHDDKQVYDQKRDIALQALNLKIIRILDKDVLKNIDGVWDLVNECIRERVDGLSTPPYGHPSRGELTPPSGHPLVVHPAPRGTPQEGN